ncbi:hypothetical protein [Blastococcus sp. TF02A-26]|uniref:hypothetical protein n=1 Tax=Blastococcus sp. TF02A-26 TaxID=2250577 RepID=UPI000DE80881|nr:hypothetical protein [Blastococcus sp. TF02A-26]RBY86897.1 hypothetical protein DQ240_08865 [Blastococcus sp. TF02A-26]
MADPGGPLVVLCQGHRCAALHRLADGGAGTAAISVAVGATRGAVLVTSGCLGRCSLGALAGVAHRAPGSGAVSPALWLSGVEAPGRSAALLRWVTGPGPITDPLRDVPADLSDAVAGVGPPPVLRPA